MLRGCFLYLIGSVQMSSMSVSNDAELCISEAVQADRIKIDVDSAPDSVTDDASTTAADRKEQNVDKRPLQVPTIVIKLDSEPSRTVVAADDTTDSGENGCPNRLGIRGPVEPDPDSISIRSYSFRMDRWMSGRRLSFLALKEAITAARQKGPEDPAVRRQRAIEQRELRATFRMAIIIAFFSGFWLGFFVVYVVHGCCPDCYVPRELDAFFFWLGYSNSSVNPILYTIFNDEFRRAFLRILGFKLAGARRR